MVLYSQLFEEIKMEFLVALGVWFFCGFLVYGFAKGQRKSYYAAGVYQNWDENHASIDPPKRLLYSKKEEKTYRTIFFMGGAFVLPFYIIYRIIGLVLIGLAHNEAEVKGILSLKFCLCMPKELCE